MKKSSAQRAGTLAFDGKTVFAALLSILLACSLLITFPVSALADEGEELAGSGLDSDVSIDELDLSAYEGVADEMMVDQAKGFAASIFTDTSKSEWFSVEGWLDYVVDNEMMFGYSDGPLAGSFGSYDSITRGQVVTILYRMAGEPSAGKAVKFKDVPSGQFYTKGVTWAVNKGIVKGYTETNTFAPDKAVTREELCKMIAEYASKVGGKNIKNNGKSLSKFPDSKKVATWAKGYMGWAVDNGVISGEKKGGKSYLNPGASAYRAAVAKMATVLRRDIMKMPNAQYTQQQREQILLAALKDAYKSSYISVQLKPAVAGRARCFVITEATANTIRFWDNDAFAKNNRARQSNIEKYKEWCKDHRDTSRDLFNKISNVAWANGGAGTKLPVWCKMTSSDGTEIYSCMNGETKYKRYNY